MISGLRETVIKRYTIERTTKTEIRPEEQSEKAESCRENLWNEIQEAKGDWPALTCHPARERPKTDTGKRR